MSVGIESKRNKHIQHAKRQPSNYITVHIPTLPDSTQSSLAVRETTKQRSNFKCHHELIIAVNLRKPRLNATLLNNSLAFLHCNTIGMSVNKKLINNHINQRIRHFGRFGHCKTVRNCPKPRATSRGRCTTQWHRENSEKIREIANGEQQAYSTRICSKIWKKNNIQNAQIKLLNKKTIASARFMQSCFAVEIC